jgi:hypothetical protein
VYIEVDPFQKRPSAEVRVTNQAGEVVALANIVESMNRKMEFVMHLRQPEPGGQYHLRAVLFFTPPFPEPQADMSADVPLHLPERTVVDEAEIEFVISQSGK